MSFSITYFLSDKNHDLYSIFIMNLLLLIFPLISIFTIYGLAFFPTFLFFIALQYKYLRFKFFTPCIILNFFIWYIFGVFCSKLPFILDV